MIKISRLADYGLVILNFLAGHPDQCLSAATAADRTGIALPTVSKVLKLLNEAEVIHSVRGPSGGYRLVKAPAQINLADIITAVDGKPAMTECCQPDHGCIHDGRCALRGNWRLINQVVIHALSQFTLADLAQPLNLNHPALARVNLIGEHSHV
jgi:FeS assembly SUF system regulator